MSLDPTTLSIAIGLDHTLITAVYSAVLASTDTPGNIAGALAVAFGAAVGEACVYYSDNFRSAAGMAAVEAAASQGGE